MLEREEVGVTGKKALLLGFVVTARREIFSNINVGGWQQKSRAESERRRDHTVIPNG